MYEEFSADQLCQSPSTRCVAPFMKMQTNIVVSPNHRLVTCLVQKNMSTLIFCEHKNLFDGVDAMLRFLQVKNSSEWSLTMVTREPADRFLSGFIDRCLRFCEHKNLFDGVDAMLRFLQVKNSSEWSLTMVTREPADRFLSGFIDRCL
ncbi:hypothetical protein OSTOST_12273, partial [Ostertagia ostertagi]